ncbi:hypothetical protein M0811_07082 [Anaeramoeba ignava]|uniref:Uncharacterized protein n=1 Tax=Anaeramoeba ignava TaxID=1746090 RepID=A0A9Q0LMA7_ANAIG|nr:hypothetical protein M0811_07082 [Anaeramoeba ignava]
MNNQINKNNYYCCCCGLETNEKSSKLKPDSLLIPLSEKNQDSNIICNKCFSLNEIKILENILKKSKKENKDLKDENIVLENKKKEMVIINKNHKKYLKELEKKIENLYKKLSELKENFDEKK